MLLHLSSHVQTIKKQGRNKPRAFATNDRNKPNQMENWQRNQTRRFLREKIEIKKKNYNFLQKRSFCHEITKPVHSFAAILICFTGISKFSTENSTFWPQKIVYAYYAFLGNKAINKDIHKGRKSIRIQQTRTWQQKKLCTYVYICKYKIRAGNYYSQATPQWLIWSCIVEESTNQRTWNKILQ